jgi:hypothetical protein
MCERVARAAQVNLIPILEACGYEIPPPPEDRAAEALAEIADPLVGVEISLRSSDISDAGKAQIMDFVKEMQEKYGGKK